jgi:signal transduction histidine kinase
MRFWQKIFLLSLALMMVTISIVSLVLLRANHQGNLEQARQNGINAHDLITGSIQTTIIHDRYQSGDSFLPEEEMLISLNRLSQSYIRPTLTSNILNSHTTSVYLELFSTEEKIFSTLPFEPVLLTDSDKGRLNVFTQNVAPDQTIDRPELNLIGSVERLSIIRAYEQGHWLYVSSLITLENRTYTLVTVHDVSTIYDLLNDQIKLFADLMLGLALAAATVLLIIAIYLTRPIAVLRRYTSRFSRGEYNIRLAVGGRDELSALGHDFNNMAEAVENNIQSLKRMNDERTRFIDNLTHEIKSPLTSIIGFADLLRQAPNISDDERKRQADFIYREGRQLEHIARLLMELTLLGRSDFDFDIVDLHDLLEETYLLSKPTMEKYQVRLALDNQHGLVRVNLELFRSLISNLVENAAKASSPGQTILLSAEKDEEGAMRILVKDEGCGIPEHELEKIMQPFYVLDKARTRKAGGAGLGLALCEEIIRVHNARINIESKLEQGTTVSVLFPVVEDLVVENPEEELVDMDLPAIEDNLKGVAAEHENEA